jgi:hypothetical protein
VSIWKNCEAREKFEIFCPSEKIFSVFILKFTLKNRPKQPKLKVKTQNKTPKTRNVLPTQNQNILSRSTVRPVHKDEQLNK